MPAGKYRRTLFTTLFAREFRRPQLALAHSATEALQAYQWPGNVRELRNILERAVLLAPGPEIEGTDLLLVPAPTLKANTEAPASPLPNTLHEAECVLIERAMSDTGGNLTRAGERLGISRDQLRLKLRKHNLDKSDST